jgi:hypothetical protein
MNSILIVIILCLAIILMINLNFKLASFSGTSGNGNDGGDEVLVEISLDGGSTFSREIEIEGNANARWSFSTGIGTASSTFDDDNNQTIFAPAGGGNRTSDGYSDITIEDITPTTQLVVKIIMNNNSGNEYWIIDDLLLTGNVGATPGISLGSISGSSSSSGCLWQYYLSHSVSNGLQFWMHL